MPTNPPNILLVMNDDMGYSDIACYGGEVQTPNLDRLAANGIRFTQFYNTARCCPTRASILTGLHPHQVGVGWKVEQVSPQFHSDSRIGDAIFRINQDGNPINVALQA